MTLRSSRGQDAGLSIRKQGFDSPTKQDKCGMRIAECGLKTKKISLAVFQSEFRIPNSAITKHPCCSGNLLPRHGGDAGSIPAGCFLSPMRIADCGLRIEDGEFLGFQSAFRIPHSALEREGEATPSLLTDPSMPRSNSGFSSPLCQGGNTGSIPVLGDREMRNSEFGMRIAD